MVRRLGRHVITGLAGVVLLWTGSAHAIYLGNPAPDFVSGDVAIGLALSDLRETLFLDWGISDAGTLQFLYGNADLSLGADGTEFGAGYRHKIGEGFDIADKPVRLGILAMARIGEIEILNAEFDYTLIDIAFGGAYTPLENLNVYAAVVFERIDQEQAGGKGSLTDSDIGLLAGAEFWISQSILAGLELHPALENDDIVIFGEFRF
ncbi:MAG: hypothetical protein IIA40_02535 [SAR324 cluster bacterium]|nr:hypothetical protein [SAR324 cluster bacterium]